MSVMVVQEFWVYVNEGHSQAATRLVKKVRYDCDVVSTPENWEIC